MILELQDRLKELLLATPALANRAVLTERAGNLFADIEKCLASDRFCVVIESADGSADDTTLKPSPLFNERILVTIFSLPWPDQSWNQTNSVEAMEEAIKAIHFASVVVGRNSVRFAVTSHTSAGADGKTAHSIIVEVPVLLT